jgi:DNA-binding response OmpR family regulator
MPHDKYTLLVVEDDADVRDVIVSSLTDFEADIIERENGRQGYETALKTRPDAILTDINMPLMNGLEMIRELRAAGYDNPIVILSAFGDRENTVQALRLGAHDFLTKPFEYKQLNDVVASALKLGAQVSEFEKLWQEHTKANPDLFKAHTDILDAKKEILKLKFMRNKIAG